MDIITLEVLELLVGHRQSTGSLPVKTANEFPFNRLIHSHTPCLFSRNRALYGLGRLSKAILYVHPSPHAHMKKWEGVRGRSLLKSHCGRIVGEQAVTFN